MAVTKLRQVRDLYFELIRRFPLRPLRTEEELDQAIAVIDSLIDRRRLSRAEKDYLDVLSDLVERYETDKHPIPPLEDAELLRHLIEIRGVPQSLVAKGTDIAESTISEVLAGKRKLSRTHIGKLARYFGVEPGAFSFDS